MDIAEEQIQQNDASLSFIAFSSRHADMRMTNKVDLAAFSSHIWKADKECLGIDVVGPIQLRLES